MAKKWLDSTEKQKGSNFKERDRQTSGQRQSQWLPDRRGDQKCTLPRVKCTYIITNYWCPTNKHVVYLNNPEISNHCNSDISRRRSILGCRSWPMYCHSLPAVCHSQHMVCQSHPLACHSQPMVCHSRPTHPYCRRKVDSYTCSSSVTKLCCNHLCNHENADACDADLHSQADHVRSATKRHMHTSSVIETV